ncbi:MAG: 4Fe-4S binding protein [Bacteriovoracaceae bacterium]|jgi:pyruvate-ferredoxin/flavodoxin oxidoreductase|nr:4Fe-4S binding protein [Bacteriovoracaceae bacterium]
MPEFKFPGKRVTTNGNQLVSKTEARISDCGVFYPITPSTEQGENFEMSVAAGTQTVFGDQVKAVEAEGEHSAQGGAIAFSVTGKRVSNFTSGQGIVYGLEQYYHAPGKLSTMVLNVGARALTKHALNVHCGHDDIMAALDTGWTMLMAKDAQQAVDQTLILRRVTELSLTPGMNIQDGFLTTHLERTFLELESELIREYLGHPSDIIDTPTEEQKELFGPTRRRIPEVYSLKNPILLGSVQNQEHYMTGVIARRCAFHQYILGFLEKAYTEFYNLTGRKYGLIDKYNCDKADTVFLSLGSSAENIEAAIDYIKETHNDNIGVMHLNVIRPFPEKAIIEAISGLKNVIILERTDEPNSGSNPIARDVRAAISKARENATTNCHAHLPTLNEEDVPRIFEGVYGLGSRDFRPENILGAYEYVRGKTKRMDGKAANDGESFIYLGVNHPYAVISSDVVSLLPESAIAVRIHSIGGWGAITTGKNMAEILGNLSEVSKLNTDKSKQLLHISANPKYGSEKKGAPTNYFLVVARERIRVNCDLNHVDVVLCCDPKIFTHTNPLNGLKPGGAFIWESNISDKEVWQRIPPKYRKQLIDHDIKLYTLNGFEVAKSNTSNEALQTRMQGNSFLGAFFQVSTFLKEHSIDHDTFLDTVNKQYHKKFGRFGDDVVASNMEVMKAGFEKTKKIPFGEVDDFDNSALKGHIISPQNCSVKSVDGTPSGDASVYSPIFDFKKYSEEFLEGDIYNQKASALTATGIMPAASGARNSKFVSRIKTPVIDPYKCTQCMSCIDVCPDTALPNTSQDLDVVLRKVFGQYVSSEKDRKMLMAKVTEITEVVREGMNKSIADKHITPFNDLVSEQLMKLGDLSHDSLDEIKKILKTLPLGYGKTRSIFQMLEKKSPGEGGLFSIFVSDLCKGCAECVDACGDHEALTMVDEDSELRGEHLSAMEFFKTLPRTPRKYLGLFDPDNIEETRAAILHNHLMVQDHYQAFVSGDGSCAGCGEKSVLRGIVTMTEALMRPVWDRKIERVLAVAGAIKTNGLAALEKLSQKNPTSYENIKLAITHLIMGIGADSLEETKKRIEKEFSGNDKNLIDALSTVLETDAANHKTHQVIDGHHQGMTVMSMTASTGCNTVYGSTHPSNPHPYPWMNSLFQDGATIGWLVAESFIMDHARRSVIPERLANLVLSGADSFGQDDYLFLTHFSDTQMSDLEILELPKVWAVGGDGALGDIGFQNVSKVILQNRPNIHILMLDTQVYSNTGGQNSDSSIMPGGFDMNQYGKYSEGKLTERKELAQIFTSGHGSPFVAAVSMANAGKYYKAVLDGLLHRGVSFIQSFTTCQPEHGVGDNMSQKQAISVRDTRGAPEFIFNPILGENDHEAFDIKANPRNSRDWNSKKDSNKRPYDATVVQWAATEGRFRRHFIKLTDDNKMINLDDLLVRITQADVIHRRYLDLNHRSYTPVVGVYTDIVDENGKRKTVGISRHMVLFCVERRKNWRRLQSRAGVENKDYRAQQILLVKFDTGKIKKEEFFSKTYELHQETLKTL